jgi:hypothetical protein
MEENCISNRVLNYDSCEKRNERPKNKWHIRPKEILWHERTDH